MPIFENFHRPSGDIVLYHAKKHMILLSTWMFTLATTHLEIYSITMAVAQDGGAVIIYARVLAQREWLSWRITSASVAEAGVKLLELEQLLREILPSDHVGHGHDIFADALRLAVIKVVNSPRPLT